MKLWNPGCCFVRSAWAIPSQHPRFRFYHPTTSWRNHHTRMAQLTDIPVIVEHKALSITGFRPGSALVTIVLLHGRSRVLIIRHRQQMVLATVVLAPVSWTAVTPGALEDWSPPITITVHPIIAQPSCDPDTPLEWSGPLMTPLSKRNWIT